MSRADATDEFERWLDHALGRAVAAEVGPGEAPAQPAYRRSGGEGPRRTLRGRLAGLGVRGAAVIGTVALAGASGGAALATGSPNPVRWGEHVVQVVSTCAG